MLLNNRILSHANALVGALNLARSEAVKRSETVTVCQRNGSNWLGGWRTITGSDCTLGGAETELSVQEAFEGLAQVHSSDTSLSFSGKGTLTPSGSVVLTLCDDRGADHARAVQVNNAGQVKSITIDPDGTALTCP